MLVTGITTFTSVASPLPIAPPPPAARTSSCSPPGRQGSIGHCRRSNHKSDMANTWLGGHEKPDLNGRPKDLSNLHRPMVLAALMFLQPEQLTFQPTRRRHLANERRKHNLSKVA